MSAATRQQQHQTGLFRRYSVLFLMTLLGYLCHVCIMPYIKIFGVTPNLLYAIIAITTVAYGKLRAFWVGVTYGLLMQIMLPSFTYLNLALYSITTLFCSFAFADKPLKTIEYERATNTSRRELPAWLRTLLCAALNTFVYEVIQVTYIYIGGSAITSAHIWRALADVFLTVLLTLAIMFPIRVAIFGRNKAKPVLKSAPLVFHQN